MGKVLDSIKAQIEREGETEENKAVLKLLSLIHI